MGMQAASDFNAFGAGHLPGHLGIRILEVGPAAYRAEMAVRPELMAPNGFLHAGSVVTLADTLSGYACIANLPEDASGFTTLELKSNFFSTAREGVVECEATPVHLGKNTQVWDARVKHRDSGRTMALFRCTQMVLYKKN